MKSSSELSSWLEMRAFHQPHRRLGWTRNRFSTVTVRSEVQPRLAFASARGIPAAAVGGGRGEESGDAITRRYCSPNKRLAQVQCYQHHTGPAAPRPCPPAIPRAPSPRRRPTAAPPMSPTPPLRDPALHPARKPQARTRASSRRPWRPLASAARRNARSVSASPRCGAHEARSSMQARAVPARPRAQRSMRAR